MEGAPMLDTTTFVGLDVHARSIKAVSLDVMTGEVRCATFGYDAGAVAEWVRSVDPKAKCVYESGVTGFDLQKRLSGLGVDCVVGAVSKMIKPSADRRRKNDRNDAEFLARMLSVGNVVEVWVPDDECEAARDLTRALEDARDDLSRSKQRLSKFLLRHGLVFDERTPTGRRKGNWTRAHWSWIESIRFAEGADNEALAYYVDAVRRAAEDKARLEGLVEAETRKPRWRRRVDSLRCLKGVDTATAADLVFEAGEFSRFRNARSFAAWVGLTPSEHSMDWQHLFGRFREGQPRLPELDRRHVAQRRVDPEVVVPVHVVRELGPELARRAERLAVDELGLQYPVGRLVDGVVVGAALGRQRPLNAEGLEHQVDLGVVELAAAVRVEDLDVRDGEGERRERRLDQPGVLPGPGGVADDLPVVEVDEQADVVPRGPDAHVGQVAAYMGARRPAAEAARDDVGHVGLVDRPGVHLEPLPAVCADQAVLPHDAADPAPADGDARPLERRLYLARAVPALAGGVGRDHGRRGGVRRGGPVGPRAHGVVRRPRDAEEPALR
ncbi:transposase, IS116/IS110/IS902 family [Collinsella aerofaciens ATCC 25986]|uniref:Transposase, IS116/IS110/IS902 family n=1 Tax=Collinsella aerofaciens (strain ATCC 25986 / DSM 3979 / JCM 10188 / KCTC 3647 / NCTC 11838 / VPI 1003) TaxID=411903 RepID=A4ECY0_COLAA|nr:transposase, IS116/IS110/IS902 family [Collinsella aerofaciens ATCC 25986]